MANDFDRADNRPLPTRNLSRLVANLRVIAERRKHQQQQQLLGWTEQHGDQKAHHNSSTPKHPAEEDTTSKTTSVSSDLQRHPTERETSANAEAVRFKGKLPCEVTLAELTAEFRALSVEEPFRSERVQKQKQAASSSNAQWHRIDRGDAEFRSMVPSQMHPSSALDEATDDLWDAQLRPRDLASLQDTPKAGANSSPEEPEVTGASASSSSSWQTTATVGFVFLSLTDFVV